MAEYPRELNNRVYLLKNFENYMTDRLRGEHPYTFDDTELTKGMVFVTRYLRLKHVILFRLSNDILQVSILQSFRAVDTHALFFLVQLLRSHKTHTQSRRSCCLSHRQALCITHLELGRIVACGERGNGPKGEEETGGCDSQSQLRQVSELFSSTQSRRQTDV